MKNKFILFAIFTLALGLSAKAQDLGKIDAEVQTQIGASLTTYYRLKNSLVADNTEIASQRADELSQKFEAVDVTKMTDAQKTVWNKLSVNLKLDAKHIKDNKDLEHQREHFIKLSNNMYALIFNFKANETEAYLLYCPMKKATWLSDSKEIKNPYYGTKMDDCGSVKATLKKNK